MKTESISIVKVGIAEIKIVKSPDRLRTSGLGSCVGIVLFDNVKKIAGLAHVMLPLSSLAKKGAVSKGKYADTAVEELIKQLQHAGADASILKAKMAGGAQMFAMQKENELMRIGPRNSEAVKEALALRRIPLLAEDIGGSSGRTIEFDPLTGFLSVKTVNQGVKYI